MDDLENINEEDLKDLSPEELVDLKVSLAEKIDEIEDYLENYEEYSKDIEEEE